MILVSAKPTNLNNKYFSKFKRISVQFVNVIINSRKDEVHWRYKLWFDHFNQLYGNLWNKITIKENVFKTDESNLAPRDITVSKYLFGLYTTVVLACKLYLLFKIKLFSEKNGNKTIIKKLTELPSNTKIILEQFESGQLFFNLFCIKNIPVDNTFDWYLYCWNELEENIKDMGLIVQDIIALEINEILFLKDIYENIISQNIRRLLGEFYTPVWLIDFMILKLNDFNNQIILDPCCGTGGFLSRVIKFYCNSLRNDDKITNKNSIAKKILTQVYGFDINPVSIIMSKIIYILTLIECLPIQSLIFQEPVDIPVFERNIFSYEQELDKFDIIIGNPPWIKFDTLTADYRKTLIEKYLSDYHLFSFSGMKAGLGFAQDDLSTIFLIVTAEKFLKKDGILFFIIKQSVFKSEAGKDFRKFSIRKKNQTTIPLKVEEVWDFRDVWPFKTGQKTVSAETAIIKLIKGQETTYPIVYWKMILKNGNKIDSNSTIDTALKSIELKTFSALPDPERALEGSLAPWILSDHTKHDFPTFADTHYYKARHGVVNDFISVFHVNINDIDSNIRSSNEKDLITIRPSNKGKIRIPNELDKDYTVEQEYLFPLIKSRHIKRWKISGHDYMVIPYNFSSNKEFDKTFLRSKTYNYLETFQLQLLSRKSRWFRNRPFYSLFGIGSYTFSPYKVVWVCLGKPYKHRFAVASSISDEYLGNIKKVLIPDNPIGFIPIYDENIAFYLCGILNSQIAELYFQNRVSEGKWSLSIYHISNFPFKKFDPENKLHKQIVEITKKLHELTRNAEKEHFVDQQEQLLNECVNKLYFNSIN